jgi:hypothetical protein
VHQYVNIKVNLANLLAMIEGGIWAFYEPVMKP